MDGGPPPLAVGEGYKSFTRACCCAVLLANPPPAQWRTRAGSSAAAGIESECDAVAVNAASMRGARRGKAPGRRQQGPSLHRSRHHPLARDPGLAPRGSPISVFRRGARSVLVSRAGPRGRLRLRPREGARLACPRSGRSSSRSCPDRSDAPSRSASAESV